MSSIHFDYEWEDPQEAKGAELRATWARLSIKADDIPITQVYDYDSRSVRASVYCPLYPLAEWIATNWWFLFYELDNKRLSRHETYRTRHNLMWAGEGYALPSLNIQPTEKYIILQWDKANLPRNGVEFIQEGTAYLQKKYAEEQFTNFINGIILRLESEGVRKSLLQEEWISINSLNRSEQNFCQMSAALGLDPFDINEQEERSLLHAAEVLPRTIFEDFLLSTKPTSIDSDVDFMTRYLTHFSNLHCPVSDLEQIKTNVFISYNSSTSWEEGHQLAKNMREKLGVVNAIFRSIDDIGDLFRIPNFTSQAIAFPDNTNPDLFDALVTFSSHQCPGFIINRTHQKSRLFTFCRALCEYMTGREALPAMVSATDSERQKRNRAFAAEFLAPSALIQQKLGDATIVDDDDIEELATDFNVSEFVIKHQIENHSLARIIR